jgi:hypothetical protein
VDADKIMQTENGSRGISDASYGLKESQDTALESRDTTRESRDIALESRVYDLHPSTGIAGQVVERMAKCSKVLEARKAA